MEMCHEPYMLYVNPTTSCHHFETERGKQHVSYEMSINVTIFEQRDTRTLHNALFVNLFVTPCSGPSAIADQLKTSRSFYWVAALANTLVDFP